MDTENLIRVREHLGRQPGAGGLFSGALSRVSEGGPKVPG